MWKCFENCKELSKLVLRSILMHYIIILFPTNIYWAFQKPLFHEPEFKETQDTIPGTCTGSYVDGMNKRNARDYWDGMGSGER